ncbi:MAG: hypothetical protein KJ069_15460 [Anaerolineae bacterium]|nr:hypothetical protein [Anaerolineae bacterium]
MGIFNTKNAKDAKSAKEFEEFKKLTEELEVETARPYAPDAPAPFKQELREQLLQAHEKRGLSWGEMGRLWRFAGTAVALLLLVVAVGLFWSAISGRGTAVGPAADTVVVATRTAVPEITPTPVPLSQTFTESDVIGWINSPANVMFNEAIQLQRYDIGEQENGVLLTLHWQPQADWPESAQLFVHLLNKDGELVRQVDVPLSKSLQDTVFLDPLPGLPGDGLPNGRYDIIIGLYDPATGQRLPVTAGNERMVVDGGTAVWLTDWEFSSGSHLCGIGFYNGDNGETFQIQPCTNIGNADGIFVVQKARPSANALVEIEVTVNYEPVTDKELFLKLHYAAPNWESFTGGGRMPIDGLSDYVPLNPEENSVTITFTGNPAEMAQIVGANQLALVVQLAYFEEGVNGRELKILAHHTYSGALDLSNPDEVRYEVVP